ncbi:ubiquitin-specific protease ubp15 [Coemansia sp. RSA 1933]|nr:ubiquitin-specific protease ubp15 [Coemansia sp. RSA 1933]
MGMYPFASPYMSLSPPTQGLSGVSAFGQPAYYAPAPQQSMYYPSAYAMPAMAAGGVLQPRMSTVSSSTVSNPPSHTSAADKQKQHPEGTTTTSESADPVRVKPPIVNEVGMPMGGFGVDQDGQYIEIKFPTFGQAQMQQMLQQLHIQQPHPQEQRAPAANGVHQPQPTTTDTKQAAAEQKLPTPVSVAQSVAPSGGDTPPNAKGSTGKALLGTSVSSGTQSPNISIYDAESFANAHMEDIVYDSKAFFWKIDNWDKLERRATSDVFKSGGHTWRILLRPFGSSHKGVLSLFLECLGTSDPSEDWRCTCRFVLAISNAQDPSHNTHGSAYHCFHRNNPNWGFTRFMKLADLRTAPAPGIAPFIEDGACTIAAYLHIIKEPST